MINFVVLSAFIQMGGHRERAELLCIAIIHTIFVFRRLLLFAAFA